MWTWAHDGNWLNGLRSAFFKKKTFTYLFLFSYCCTEGTSWH
jgi:hypothetical protein